METFAPSLLLLLSALIHAGWNASTKLAKDKDPFVFLTIFFASVFLILGIAIQERDFILGDDVGKRYAVIAGFFEAGYFISIAKGFVRASLAKAYSVMRGGAMVLVWIISLSLGLENFNTLSLIGSLIVLSGIVVSGLDSSKTRSAQFNEMVWPIVGAFFITGYHLCYGKSLEHGSEPKALFFTSLLISMPFIFFMTKRDFLRRAKAVLRSEKTKLLISSFGAASGFVIFLYGLKHSGPGFAITLRNTSIFFSIGFAYLIKDKMTKNQMVGAAVVGAGAMILSLAEI